MFIVWLKIWWILSIDSAFYKPLKWMWLSGNRYCSGVVFLFNFLCSTWELSLHWENNSDCYVSHLHTYSFNSAAHSVLGLVYVIVCLRRLFIFASHHCYFCWQAKSRVDHLKSKQKQARQFTSLPPTAITEPQLQAKTPPTLTKDIAEAIKNSRLKAGGISNPPPTAKPGVLNTVRLF